MAEKEEDKIDAKVSNRTCRHFVWTQHRKNKKPTHEDLLKIYEDNKDEIRYMVFQKEKCPETKKKHFQGYIELKEPARFSKIVKLFYHEDWPAIWKEERKGTRDGIRAYCMKEKTRVKGPWECGEWISGQGARTDLKKVYDMINEGKKISEVAYKNPGEYIKFNRGIEKYKFVTRKLRKGFENIIKTKLIVIVGGTGTGKSHYVNEKYGLDNIFHPSINNGNLWFDGYDDEKIICFEEFHGEIPIQLLLRIGDKWNNYIPPVKGAFIERKWKKVIIVSNKPIRKWYPFEDDEVLDALYRRVDKYLFKNINFLEKKDEEEIAKWVKIREVTMSRGGR